MYAVLLRLAMHLSMALLLLVQAASDPSFFIPAQENVLIYNTTLYRHGDSSLLRIECMGGKRIDTMRPCLKDSTETFALCQILPYISIHCGNDPHTLHTKNTTITGLEVTPKPKRMVHLLPGVFVLYGLADVFSVQCLPNCAPIMYNTNIDQVMCHCQDKNLVHLVLANADEIVLRAQLAFDGNFAVDCSSKLQSVDVEFDPMPKFKNETKFRKISPTRYIIQKLNHKDEIDWKCVVRKGPHALIRRTFRPRIIGPTTAPQMRILHLCPIDAHCYVRCDYHVTEKLPTEISLQIKSTNSPAAGKGFTSKSYNSTHVVLIWNRTAKTSHPANALYTFQCSIMAPTVDRNGNNYSDILVQSQFSAVAVQGPLIPLKGVEVEIGDEISLQCIYAIEVNTSGYLVMAQWAIQNWSVVYQQPDSFTITIQTVVKNMLDQEITCHVPNLGTQTYFLSGGVNTLARWSIVYADQESVTISVDLRNRGVNLNSTKIVVLFKNMDHRFRPYRQRRFPVHKDINNYTLNHLSIGAVYILKLLVSNGGVSQPHPDEKIVMLPMSGAHNAPHFDSYVQIIAALLSAMMILCC